MGGRRASILLVEDQDAHARLVEAVLEDLGDPVDLYRVESVDQALQLLSQSGPHASVLEPGLVLLDLNMPVKSGYVLLAAMKADVALAHIRVVIFSSADHPDEIAKSLSRGAYAHIGKPVTYQAYESALRRILEMMPDDGSTTV